MVGLAELPRRVGRASMADLPSFVEHLRSLLAERPPAASSTSQEEADRASEAVARRMADIFSKVKLDEVMDAMDVLKAFDAGIGSSHTSVAWRVLQERLANLVQQQAKGGGGRGDPTREFLALSQCYSLAQDAQDGGLGGDELRTVTVARVAKWLESAQLRVLGDQCAAIGALAKAEAPILRSLLDRLLAISRRGLPLGQAQHFARLLCDLGAGQGLELLGSSRPLLDAVIGQLRTGFGSWPEERLVEELFDPWVVRLCHANAAVGATAKAAVVRRLCHGLRSVFSGLDGRSAASFDLAELQADVREWTALVKKAHNAALIEFDQPTRYAIMDAVSQCFECCLESHASSAMDEVQRLQWSMMVLLGGDLARTPSPAPPQSPSDEED